MRVRNEIRNEMQALTSDGRMSRGSSAGVGRNERAVPEVAISHWAYSCVEVSCHNSIEVGTLALVDTRHSPLACLSSDAADLGP